jgi:hypothetical protein
VRHGRTILPPVLEDCDRLSAAVDEPVAPERVDRRLEQRDLVGAAAFVAQVHVFGSHARQRARPEARDQDHDDWDSRPPRKAAPQLGKVGQRPSDPDTEYRDHPARLEHVARQRWEGPAASAQAAARRQPRPAPAARSSQLLGRDAPVSPLSGRGQHRRPAWQSITLSS